MRKRVKVKYADGSEVVSVGNVTEVPTPSDIEPTGSRPAIYVLAAVSASVRPGLDDKLEIDGDDYDIRQQPTRLMHNRYQVRAVRDV